MSSALKLERLLIIGDFQLSRGKYQYAHSTYLKCLAIAPNEIEVLCNLGFILSELKQDRKALSYLKKAFKIDSTDEYVLLNLGSALIGIREYSKAISVLHSIKNKNHLVYNNLGWAYYKVNKHQEALKNFNFSIEKENNNPDAYTNRGLLKINCLADIDGGVKDLEKGSFLGDVISTLKLMQLKHRKNLLLLN